MEGGGGELGRPEFLTRSSSDSIVSVHHDSERISGFRAAAEQIQIECVQRLVAAHDNEVDSLLNLVQRLQSESGKSNGEENEDLDKPGAEKCWPEKCSTGNAASLDIVQSRKTQDITLSVSPSTVGNPQPEPAVGGGQIEAYKPSRVRPRAKTLQLSLSPSDGQGPPAEACVSLESEVDAGGDFSPSGRRRSRRSLSQPSEPPSRKTEPAKIMSTLSPAGIRREDLAGGSRDLARTLSQRTTLSSRDLSRTGSRNGAEISRIPTAVSNISRFSGAGERSSVLSSASAAGVHPFCVLGRRDHTSDDEEVIRRRCSRMENNVHIGSLPRNVGNQRRDTNSSILTCSEPLFLQRTVWLIDDEQRNRIQYRSNTVSPPTENQAKKGSNGLYDDNPYNVELPDMTEPKAGRFAVHPQSAKRLLWDILSIFLLSYDLIFVPMQVFEFSFHDFFLVMDWLAILFWTTDIFFSCITGVYINGRLDMRIRHICKRYAYTWFPFDVLVVGPEWIVVLVGDSDDSDGSLGRSMGMARALRWARYLRFLRYVRMLRIVRWAKVISSLKDRINSTFYLLFLSIARLIIQIIYLIHILACLWFGIGKASNEGWVYMEKIDQMSAGEQYIYTFQWAMARLHPSNFGNAGSVVTIHERIFCIIISLIAVAGAGLFLSSITNTMAQLQQLQQQRTRKLYVVRAYVRENRITTRLAVRLKKYVERTMNRKLREQHAAELEQMLPRQLLMDLHFEAWSRFIGKHVFFRTVSQQFPRVIWCLGKDAMAEFPMLSGETSFSTGDACHKMLFLISGEFKYVLGQVMGKTASSFEPIGSIRSDQNCGFEDESEDSVWKRGCFSEPVLWTPWENCGEMFALTDSTLLEIDADSFIQVFSDHERAKLLGADRAKKVIEWLNVACDDGETISDVLPDSLTEFQHNVKRMSTTLTSCATRTSLVSVTPG